MNPDSHDAEGAASRKFALVTGASSGIGRAIALGLGGAGFSVILTARRRGALAETLSMIQPAEACVAALPCDLAQDASIESLASRVDEITGNRLALLVNCAGTYHMGPFGETPRSALDLILRVNFRAPYLLSEMLLPALRAAQGTVVFINSTAGLSASAGVAAYAASKAALKALADSMRDEFSAEDLRVVSIFPGRTDTPMGQKVFRLEGRDPHPDLLVQPEDVAAAVITAVTLPLRAQVTDLKVTPGRRIIPVPIQPVDPTRE